jgi:hypothetical protein
LKQVGSVFRTGDIRQNLAKLLVLLARSFARKFWAISGHARSRGAKDSPIRQGVAKPLQSENGPEGSEEPKLKKQGFDWGAWTLKSKQKSHVSQHVAQEFGVYELHNFPAFGGCRQTFWAIARLAIEKECKPPVSPSSRQKKS